MRRSARREGEGGGGLYIYRAMFDIRTQQIDILDFFFWSAPPACVSVCAQVKRNSVRDMLHFPFESASYSWEMSGHYATSWLLTNGMLAHAVAVFVQGFVERLLAHN